LKKWYTIQHPEIFQGDLNKKAYYEGWYFKLVDAEFNNVISFIPTIALNKKEGTSHPFIQVFDGKNSKAYDFPYIMKDFKASSKSLDIRIGNNRFTKKGIYLDINHDEHRIKGTLNFSNLTEIPSSPFSPGIMGPFSFLPFLSTYHGIVSMNHQISGSLRFNERNIIFKKGSKGYIEKDWGKTFPSAWIWMQTNHFKKYNRSFMLSIAKVPFMNQNFLGFLSVLWDNGRFYKFTTYSGARVRLLKIGGKKVSIVLEDKNHLLFIKGNQGKSTLLKAPSRGVMKGDCYESLMSEISVKLFKKNGTHIGDILLSDMGINSGLEIMNPNILQTK
jgi:hypothetical protein